MCWFALGSSGFGAFCLNVTGLNLVKLPILVLQLSGVRQFERFSQDLRQQSGGFAGWLGIMIILCGLSEVVAWLCAAGSVGLSLV